MLQEPSFRITKLNNLTGIPTMKNENVFDQINHLDDIAKIDNFTQEQIEIAHHT